MSPEEARSRLAALGFSEHDAGALADLFLFAEATGRSGHGIARIEQLEARTDLDATARPVREVVDGSFERWNGNGAVGYVTMAEIVESVLADPPAHVRVIAAGRTSPTGALGYWTRRLADAGLVAVLTGTSPKRLAPPAGGPKLTGTNPLSIAIPSSEGPPIVSDVSMANVNFGDVLAGKASEDDLGPFGGEHAHKAFALAVGLQLLVDALAPVEGNGAVLLVARPSADPVPAFRALADGARLPGDSAKA